MGMPMQAPQQPTARPGGGEQQAMIKQKLMELLGQAAAIAQKNGIVFEELVMQFMQSQGGGGKPAAPKPPMGGGMGMMG